MQAMAWHARHTNARGQRFQFTIEGGPCHGKCLCSGSSWPEGTEVSQDSGNRAQRVVHQQRQTDIQNLLSGLVWFLLHLACTVTECWSAETWKQSRVSCLSGWNPPLSVPKRFDFHNSTWNFSFSLIWNNSSGIMGSFWITSFPLTFSIPLIVVFRYHESAQRLSKLHSKCNRQIMFRYCLMEESFSLRARNTTYLATITSEAGTGTIPDCSQKAMYAISSPD